MTDLPAKSKLIVRAELIYTKGKIMSLLNAHFPPEENLYIAPNISFGVSFPDQKLKLQIVMFHEYWIKTARLDAFKHFDGSKEEFIQLYSSSGTIKGFIEENLPMWIDSLARIFHLMRWLYNSSIYDSGLVYIFKWSIDEGKTWNHFQSVRSTSPASTLVLVSVNPQKLTETVNDSNIEESVHFTFLREAQEHLTINPRSALLMMVVALETGMKRFLVEKEATLESKFNGETPPSLEYIFNTMLNEQESALTFTNDAKKEFQNLISARNILVHRGRYSMKDDSLAEKFGFVSDILYIIDFFRGNTVFGQPFYQIKQRLVNNHFVNLEEKDNIGVIVEGIGQTITFETKRS